jgi:glycine cleavage system H protein
MAPHYRSGRTISGIRSSIEEEGTMEFPDELRYTKEHEWARVEGERVRVGITDFAQDALGDVVYVDLPAVGTRVNAAESVGELESTKSVSEMYAPIGGVVSAVNEALTDNPQLLNEDPYGEGWLIEIEPSDIAELERLLDADAYRTLTEG